MMVKSPKPKEVERLRIKVQRKRGIGITAAQTLCAEQIYTSLRAWQQWEREERAMHPAFWELAVEKVTRNILSPE